MATLSKEHRKLLENTVAAARKIAVTGAEKALLALRVGDKEAPSDPAQKELRSQLRAHGRQLGDQRYPNGIQETSLLAQACAYEHWHRLLFARFLAENDLLINPEFGVPMSLAEVQETAREQNCEWLNLASGYAQQMLLEVFRPDDPVLRVIMPPETRQELEESLASLPTEIFAMDDSLGWVYQFWQRDEKNRVNKSEDTIGAIELPPVTQLFTEDYMVLFLLHNTLGAWWTAKRLAEGKTNELPGYEWTYLHLNDSGFPAAGGFDHWPRTARELRVLDPCMGSGHFLAFALPVLSRMRQEEEGLPLIDAIVAVLTENLYGLELDPRCSQIAAFNLALTAWRMATKPIPLPPLNLACTGLGINAPESAWAALAGADDSARTTMQRLYQLFSYAPVLGSLVDPTRLGRELFSAEYSQVQPLLMAALAMERDKDEDRELAIAARGLLVAAGILAREFTLIATNVPYLGRGNQNEVLRRYCEDHHSSAKGDLATAFLDRCVRFCSEGSSIAVVSKQEPLSLTTFKDHRIQFLRSLEWNFVARLGPRAFETITGERVNVALLGFTRLTPKADHDFPGWDVGHIKKAAGKALALAEQAPASVSQRSQRENPDSVIAFEAIDNSRLLGRYATCYQGLSTGDAERLIAAFWEVTPTGAWAPLQMPPMSPTDYGGREYYVNWGVLERGFESAAIRGREAWGRRGIAIGQVNSLPATLFTGELFADSTPVIVPHSDDDLLALWAFCRSSEFNVQMRRQNPKLSVNNGYVGKIPFDLKEWRQIAADRYATGLPSPRSNDPTQWLFDGHPAGSRNPLQVAVARLVGYQWPRQVGCKFPACPAIDVDDLDPHSDTDGIVCLSSIAGEASAVDRLRALLFDAFGNEWTAAKLAELLGNCSSLEVWLRDRFFEEHCQVFHQRPFVWHVWDGRKDGFHALVNYHKLAGPDGGGRKTLEKLIYTSLGDWIKRQRGEAAEGKDGAESRLAAALHLHSQLEKILEGEGYPLDGHGYDIFIRWKPLREQALGWEPDLNDGVRLNIRPWLYAQPYQASGKDACILRVTPIKLPLGIDRGGSKEARPDPIQFPWVGQKFQRNNDVYLTLKQKREAREQKKKV